MHKYTLSNLILSTFLFFMFLMKPETTSTEGIFSNRLEKKVFQKTTPSPIPESPSLRDDLCPITDLDCEEPTGSANHLSIPNEENLANTDVIVVLFWMQDCVHCEEVLNTVLPDIETTYHDQVAIFPIELKEIETIDTFYTMAERLGVAKNNIGVPLVIIGDQVLTGDEIKQKLDSLINKNLQVDDYQILAIPEFEDYLPLPIQSLETIHSTQRSWLSNHNLLIGLMIGVTVFVIILVVVITRKKQSK